MLKIHTLIYDHDNFPQESRMIDRLIDRILILWAVLSCTSLLFSLTRALDIGWSHRDITQITIVSLNILVAIYREKYTTNQKALFLVMVNLVLGIIGILTLGMFAAGIFFLPVATVIIALLYPKQIVISFSVISILFMTYIAYGFAMGRLELPVSAEALLTNPRHWTFYVFCMGFFLFITCSTILSYRTIVQTLLTEIKTQRDQLEQLANSDPLTGLCSMHCFKERLKYCCQQSQRYNTSFALLFVDLDDFKQINDTYGHDFGDECLITTANRLADKLRQTDTISRIGGDEFMIILEGVKSPRSISVTAQKILDAVAEPITFHQQTFQIGCSVGAAIYPDHTNDISTLKILADRAMYRAKAEGKNNFCIFAPADDASGSEVKSMLAE